MGVEFTKDIQKLKVLISDQKSYFKNSINNKCEDTQFWGRISSRQRKRKSANKQCEKIYFVWMYPSIIKNNKDNVNT